MYDEYVCRSTPATRRLTQGTQQLPDADAYREDRIGSLSAHTVPVHVGGGGGGGNTPPWHGYLQKYHG